MASTLYQEIFRAGKAEGLAKGMAKGMTRGQVRTYADLLVDQLSRRLGELDPAVSKRIRKTSNLETLKVWYDEAAKADVDAARKLVDRIRATPVAVAPAP